MIRHGYKNSKRLSSFQCQLFRRIPSSFQRHQQSTQVDDTVNTSRGHTNSNTKSENDDTRGVKNDSEEMRKIPFYGQPRPDGWKYGEEYTKKGNSSLQNRIVLALHYATTAFVDPTRADAVAALGEITGSVSLRRIYQEMEADPIGRQILQDRPIVSKATIPYAELIANAPANENDIVTFGHAYGYFLRLHGFDPDERDEVKYIEDETLAYIMLRYRQCHDFWHALTGLPPTVLGELGLKYVELFETGLPIAALSSTVGSLRLNSSDRQILFNTYLPWAIDVSSSPTSTSSTTNDSNEQNLQGRPQRRQHLMNVYYEKEFDTPLVELRSRLHLKPAPKI